MIIISDYLINKNEIKYIKKGIIRGPATYSIDVCFTNDDEILQIPFISLYDTTNKKQ